MPRRKYTPEDRANALALYATEGPTAVQEQLGIPKQTVQDWAAAEGVRTVRNERTAAATEAHALDWAERRAAMVSDIGRVAAKALGVAEEMLDTRTTNKAAQAATVMAILVDKAQLLGGDATSRHENRELRDRLLDEARSHAQHLRSVA